MSKHKFTKGQWVISEKRDKNKNGTIDINIDAPDAKLLSIATIYSFGEHDINAESDAKLICASKDILFALEDILNYCRLNSTSQLEPLIRKAEKAVEKATS